MNTKKTKLSRRNFIKSAGMGAAVLSIPGRENSLKANNEESSKSLIIKKKRMLGRTGFMATEIGIGSSRAHEVPVLNALLDAGVNYIDTAESYGRGRSEKNIGKAIEKRDRKKLFITTKLHLNENSGEEEIIKRLKGSLKRLNTPYVDCLLLHGAPNIETLKNRNFHSAAKKLKSEGKLRFIGVSNHGARFGSTEDVMKKILLAAVEDGRFDLILLVYNFLKTVPGEEIIDACKKKNIAVTIMKSNPVGRFYETKERIENMKREGRDISPRMLRYYTELEKTASKASDFIKANNLKSSIDIRNAALKFVLKNKKTGVLNFAFRSFEDVESVLKVSGDSLSKSEINVLGNYAKGPATFYCRHACGLCEPSCPNNIPVNTIMRYNHYFESDGSEKYAIEKYSRLNTSKPDICKSCKGYCESSCPYKLPVKSLLVSAHKNLTIS